MALLTDATVIVQAWESSGTLHQGWEALRLGRPFLMESLTKDPRLRWPEEMIRYGAQVLSRDNLDAALDAIPERTRGSLLSSVPFASLLTYSPRGQVGRLCT